MAATGETPPPSPEPEPEIDDPRGPAPGRVVLEIGDAAPPIMVSAWVGTRTLAAVDFAPANLDGTRTQLVPFEPGVVTMIDFWASWCAPCLASMSHTAALQARHPDRLRVLALTSLDEANTRRAVDQAVRRTAAMEHLVVAIDAGERTTAAYRFASGERGLPRAFVVDDEGRLAWTGHPTEADAVVEAILAGRWNAEAEREHRRDIAGAIARGQSALEALHRAEAIGDAEARLEALRALAALPAEAQVIAPPSWPRCAVISQLAAMERLQEADEELEFAAIDARSRKDGALMAGLAVAAIAIDADFAVALAGEAERTLDGRIAAWNADPRTDSWSRYRRSTQMESLAGAFAELATVHRSQRRFDDAIRLQSRAIELGRELPEVTLEALRAQRDEDEAARAAGGAGGGSGAGGAGAGSGARGAGGAPAR